MQIVKTISEIQAIVTTVMNQGKTVGFVPTMGYLHEGHISLVDEAQKTNDFIVMSIFVNPLQFGPNEDFDRYPRDIERDEAIAKQANVDVIFYPDVKEMYPRKLTSSIQVHDGVDVLCGKSRPGHFDGVATVVLKLFNIIQPNHAYFGMKDAQQVAVIENMVEDFNVPVEIIKCPTLREEDGLAKSSRNVYLSDLERQEASEIFKSLQLAKTKIDRGERDAATIKKLISAHLNEHTSSIIDYVEILSYPALQPVSQIKDKVIFAVASKFEKARLIDNITLTIKDTGE